MNNLDKLVKRNKNTLYLVYVGLLVIFILALSHKFYNHCESCEGLSDGSYCMPTINKLFYLKTKLGKKVYLDFKNGKLKLDSSGQSAFHIRGCLTDIFKVTYLRYNTNTTKFTTGFSLITVDDKMGITDTVKNLKKTNEDILLIKRVYSTTNNYVRLGIRHNKKFYWYNETEKGDWLWTTDLKNANTFEVVYY
jgi:hypothetical protein